jgi:hypothetical protein
MKRVFTAPRAITSLIVLGLLLSATATPALAKKGGGGGGNPHAQTSPYLELGMCKDSLSTDFIVDVYWGNQTPGGSDLDVVVTFKDGGTSEQFGGAVAAPVPATGGASFHVPQFTGANGPIDWNTWSAVSAVSAGAFDATASAVREPHTGWGTCYF